MSCHRTIIRLSAVLAVVALTKGCGDGENPAAPPTPEPARPTTVTVSPATHELTALGTTVQLSAEVRDQNARVMAGATVTWTSSASSMATVDASGLVTAAGNGTATITASAGSASGSAVVTVMQSVASVEVSPSVYELTALGQTVQLTAEAFDENGHAVAGAEFSWESSDVAAATVDGMGLVTGIGAGEVEVTATSSGVTGRAVVVVVEEPDLRISEMYLFAERTRPTSSGGSLSDGARIEQARLRVGEELVLSAVVRCDDGETYAAGRYDAPCFKGDDRVAWNSSDPVVATVALGYSDYSAHRSAGVVRSAGLGPATITAAFKGHSASLAIEVVSGAALTERATMDRPDDVGGAQIHFVYAVPVGGHDRSFDRAGDIAFMADQMQKWLQAEAGMTWRFDTYQGRLDVSFLPIQWQGTQDLGTIMAQFHKALEERDGQLKPHKKYAVFFDYDDAQGGFPVSGVASREVAVTLAAGPLHEHFAGVAIHEVIHTFGAVASCAPNSTPGMHVSDYDQDIMGGGGLIGGVLDWGRDDYFGHDNRGCLDIADNAYWERQ